LIYCDTPTHAHDPMQDYQPSWTGIVRKFPKSL